MRNVTIFAFILLSFGTVFAQTTLYKGVVTDAKYKTPVAYAAVFVESAPIGTVANNVGEFSFSFPDSVAVGKLVIVREGFAFKRIAVDTVAINQMKIELEPDDLEQKAIVVLDSINARRESFGKILGKAAKLVFNDWIPLGNPEINKFDFGRIQTLPTYNPVEGVRLRAGVASNSRLSPHFFVKGYAAYGFKDQKFNIGAKLFIRSTKKPITKTSFRKITCVWCMKTICIRPERCTRVHKTICC